MKEKITLEDVKNVFEFGGINKKYLVIIEKYKLWFWAVDSLRELLDASEVEYWSTRFSDSDEYDLRRAVRILMDMQEDKT